MTRILTWEEIEAALGGVDLVAEMERAFQAYSEGRAVVPPVGELLLEEPRGEVHIKYGYVREEPGYVVKIASGFPANAELGRSPNDGLMILFDRTTGEPEVILLDGCRLTDLRTAAAGAVAARHLAPPVVTCIGLLGTGIQARLQMEHLRSVIPCREILAWGRDTERLAACLRDLRELGFDARAAGSPGEVGESCELVVTTTASEQPLLESVRPGAHVTAIGSDTPTKQELSAELVARMDVMVVDSRAQASLRGEVARAAAQGRVRLEDALELGEVIGGQPGRTSAGQLTLADLTGVAVQDLAIARAVSGAPPQA